MTLAINWHTEAEAEFVSDIDWHDGQQVGLGERFEGRVFNAVVESAAAPNAWQP